MNTATAIESAEDLIGIEDYKYDTVHVPEWNRTVTIRSMNAEDLVNWIDSLDGPTKKTAGVRMIIGSVVNPDTKQLLFTSEHIGGLKKKNARALGVLVNRCRAINGLNEEAKPHTCSSCGHIDTGKPEGDTAGEESGGAR